MAFDLRGYLERQSKRVNAEIEMIFGRLKNSARIVEAMSYAVLAGGKRIRPILCLAASDAVDGDAGHSMSAACAIEFIHTYSLIHDDLPALDDDDMRRGAPTCHIRFGEATAILAGDALLTLAFETIAQAGLRNVETVEKWMDVMRILAQAAGYKGMIEGQMRDLEAEGRELSLEKLKTMHELKTGAIIEAAVHIGALLAGGSAEQIKRLRIYGSNIGLAFQVTDDLLNIQGDPKIMGKAVGTDRQKKKNTYPSLMGVERSEAYARKQIEDALQAIDSFDNKATPLRAVANYILQRNR